MDRQPGVSYLRREVADSLSQSGFRLLQHQWGRRAGLLIRLWATWDSWSVFGCDASTASRLFTHKDVFASRKEDLSDEKTSAAAS
jgi:hypothetical protein